MTLRYDRGINLLKRFATSSFDCFGNNCLLFTRTPNQWTYLDKIYNYMSSNNQWLWYSSWVRASVLLNTPDSFFPEPQIDKISWTRSMAHTPLTSNDFDLFRNFIVQEFWVFQRPFSRKYFPHGSLDQVPHVYLDLRSRSNFIPLQVTCSQHPFACLSFGV
jgi:hypothetical protein